jgi:chromosome partitioning protein
LTRVLVVANQKGGVGKTTSVANLGAALYQMGQRVLLIDLDPQAALTATYGIDPYALKSSMYSVLLDQKMPLTHVLKPVGKGGHVALAPASIDLAAAEVQLVNAQYRAFRLKRALVQNKVPFDFIIIDTPPSLGLITLNGLVGGTEVLIPVQAHFLAMRGVRGLMETIWRVKKKLNPHLRLLGVLPTMVSEESRHNQEVIQELRSVFGGKVYDFHIGLSMKFAEVPIAQQTLVEYAPYHPGAVAYKKLAEAIVNDRPKPEPTTGG